MKRIAVLIPCYNEERTVAGVVRDFRSRLPDADIYVYDNNSSDRTAEEAAGAGAIVRRESRQGKGNVIRSMFRQIEADVYVMVDGDGTYPADRVYDLIGPVLRDEADMVNGSRLHSLSRSRFRILNRLGNRLFLFLLSAIFNVRLTDLLSGYRAFTRKVLETVPIERNSDDFVFDNQMLSQIHYLGFSIAEVTCPAKYFEEASSINFRRSLGYGLGCLWTAVQFRLAKMGIYRPKLFR